MGWLASLRRRRIHPLVTGMLCGALALTPAIPASAQAQESGDAIVVYSGGLDALLPDAKDAALREAVSMLDARLMELPRELEEFRAPPAAIDLAMAIVRSPLTVRIAVGDPAEGPPVRASATVRPADIKAANELVNGVLGMARMMRMELAPAERAGIFRVEGAPLPVYIGTAEGGGLFVGVARTEEPAALAVSALPAGVEPALAARVDLRAMQALIETQLTDEPDGFARELLRSLGIVGEDALMIDAAVGYDATRSHAAVRLKGYAARARNMGMAPDMQLGREFLSLIPRDATRLSAGTFDLGGLLEFVERLSESSGETMDIEGAFRESTGLDLREDVVAAFGNRYAWYQSDVTGGGWIASSVLLMELADPAALERIGQRIVGSLRETDPDAPVHRYVRIHEWSLGEASARTLTFPGLPVPMELSWTIDGGLFVGAFSPNGLRAAVAQRGGERESILNDERFMEMCGGNPDAMLGVNYVNVPALAPRGYGLTSVGVSMLRNAVRSPWDPTRQPAADMPPFHEFIADVQPTVGVVYADGDDLIYRVQADRSALVNMAGAARTASSTPMPMAAISMLVGVLLPALQSARESATQIKSASTLRQIAVAAMTYANEHDDRLPTTIEQLGPYLGGMELASPYGPAIDGGADYAIRGDLGRFAFVERPSRTILGVDRAAAVNFEDRINVAFVDGHVESLTIDEFDALLREEQNEGAAGALDLPDWE